MTSTELRTKIRRLFHAEHWKVGTIAAQLGVHHDVVRNALEVNRFANSTPRVCPRALDRFVPFMTMTLEKYPTLRSTRLHEMLVERGHTGSVIQTRRLVRILRPKPKAEAFLHLETMPGEQGQVDWGSFGTIVVGNATRLLSAFVMVLSWSRAMHVVFTLDQTLENFLRGHVESFAFFRGVPRVILYDNLKSAVLERFDDVIRFHPRLLEYAGHYHFEPRPCAVARGNEKGRVERLIRFLRDRFFAARTFHSVEDLNEQFAAWRVEWAHARPCPGDRSITVAAAFDSERPVLLPLPKHAFNTDLTTTIASGKTPYLRFDRNDYSIPHELVRKPLTVIASPTVVRIVSGDVEVARHVRSYEKARRIEDRRHVERLVEQKRAARETTMRSHILRRVPPLDRFLREVVQRGHSVGNAVQQISKLLELYGDKELAVAIEEALERGTIAPSAVAHILDQRRRHARKLPVLHVELSNDPRVRDLKTTPHDLKAYDDLA